MEFKSKTNQITTIRFSEKTLKKLDEIAEKENTTRAEVVRVFVEKGIKEYEK
mgnify:CR=1 FL=1